MQGDKEIREAPCPPSFEMALGRLEVIVAQLEDGEIGLAEALERYEEGVKLLKECYGLLERAERKIELLNGFDAQGNPVTEPFHDEASLPPDGKPRPRGRRRSMPETPPDRSSQAAGQRDEAPRPPGPPNDIDSPDTLF